MFDINKPVTNPKLIEIIDRLKTNYVEENEHEFFKELLSANFLAPVVIEPIPENKDGKTVLKEGTKINFIAINNEKGENFFPAFTDWNELRKWSDKIDIQTFILTFKDYEEMIFRKENDTWVGFVINPYGEDIVINREKMRVVNNNDAKIEKDESVIIGIPKEYPNEMVNSLKEYFSKVNSVKSAYILLMIRNQGEKSYLMVIDTDNNPNKVFEKVTNVATKYLKVDEKIDFVTLSDSFGKDAIVGQQPFYQK
ncbi:hypothetical protein CWR48_16340 [Oceanobacillus arenosus]|uniref:Enhanced serine sensitivity protein SseB n=1 Tax=Oceanobacillus arenosus TaxID=1229153 RepID=A0A3D8PLC0_9BACI|nr:enhanced serine sensitivity protein SseB [Oceanobacillus arenosus]RDW16452.1 hypothetical protein CWR48_16340 [Oceanobacillus arenosus]